MTKVGSFCSEIIQIIYGVPQGSILGHLLNNVNLIDLFLAEHYKSNFSNYADDSPPYNCTSTFDNLFYWFCYNNFKANASNRHLLLSPFNTQPINIKSSLIERSSSEKFIGITIDSNFTTLLLKNI